MDGLGNFIASMSVVQSQSNLVTDASIAVMKNIMNTEEAASGKLIESISEAAPSADGRGALMDVRA